MRTEEGACSESDFE